MCHFNSARVTIGFHELSHLHGNFFPDQRMYLKDSWPLESQGFRVFYCLVDAGGCREQLQGYTPGVLTRAYPVIASPTMPCLITHSASMSMEQIHVT